MKCLRMIAGLMALVGVAANAAPPRMTVFYRIPGQDPLSIKFRAALAARIRKDPQLRLAPDMASAQLKIESPSRSIDWDTLGGRMVAIYILSIAGNGKDFRLSGVCYTTNMDKCARDIIGRSKHFALGLS